MHTNDHIFQPADYGVLSNMMADTNKAITITIGIFVFLFTLSFVLVNIKKEHTTKCQYV